MDDYCGSRFWDLNITWYTDDPEFTDCFKNTALVWIPCFQLWIFLPFEIYKFLNSKNRDIPLTLSNSTKFITILLMIAISIMELSFDLFSKPWKPKIYYYSAAFECLTLVLFLIIIWLNKRTGIRFSKASIVFPFLLALSQVVQWRKVNLKDIEILQIVNFITTCTNCVLNCFQDSKPRYSYNEKHTSSLFPLSITFLPTNCINTFIWKSYRQPNKAIICDLRIENKVHRVYPRFERIWKKSGTKTSNSNGETFEHSLVQTLVNMFWITFANEVFIKTVYDLLGICTPLIYVLFIDSISKQASPWKGYLCAALFLVQVLLQLQFQSRITAGNAEIDGVIKTTVASAIYRKSLKISNSARKKYTTADITNLISVDTSNLIVLKEIISIISTLLQATTLFCILWYLLGYSTIFGILVAILFIPYNHYLAKTEKKYQQLQAQHKDKRAKFMQELLCGVKVLKMYVWESSFQTEALKLRNDELRILMKLSYLKIITTFSFIMIPFITSLVTFTAYVLTDDDHILDVRTAFISVLVFASFKTLQYKLPISISSLLQAKVSVKRIDDFLNSEELDKNSITHDTEVKEALIIDKGTFSWSNGDNTPTLQDIDLKIKENDLVAIVGVVGSGKSSLLSAFLGDMCKISGSVNVKGKIAYVPQQAWILNCSLKENITLWENINEKQYKNALHACALEEDIASFPDGDSTEIGEKGINLSGGQKQRVSMARAICSKADIFVFDDPLSAVDSSVASHIFERILGPSSMLKDKTRVLVTHSVKFLPQMDQIIVMKNGSIEETGTYEELLNNNKDFAEFLKIHSNEIQDDTAESGWNETNTDTSKELRLKENQNSKSTGNEKKLIKEELKISQQIKQGTYPFLLKSFGMTSVILFVSIFSIFEISSMLSYFWLLAWTCGHFLWVEDRNSHSQYYYLIVYAILGLLQSISNILGGLILCLGFLKASKNIFQQLLTNVLKWPMWIFDSTPVGRITGRFIDDTYNIEGKLASEVGMLIFLSSQYACSMLVLIWIMPSIVAAVIPFLFACYLVQKTYFSTSRNLQRIMGSTRSPVYSHFMETVNGLQSIRAYGYEQKFTSLFDAKLECSTAAYVSFYYSITWLFRTCDIFCGILIFCVTYHATQLASTVNIGLLTLAISFTLQVRIGLAAVVYYLNFIMEGMISVERIKEYVDYPTETNSDSDIQNVPANWPQNGAIVFQNYKMKYRTGLDLVLKGISFDIQGGEKVGIIGRTGAGKTSILSALFRIVEPEDGTIFIDSVDISKIQLQTLRSKLTVIPQDPVLFMGTLRFNLDPFVYYTDENIWNVLETIRFKEYFENLPLGLSFNIEEGGNNLSFGQRQLICLARALLRKTKILILDEATASVDLETDEFVQQIIRKNFSDCTVLTIAHRLHTIQDYDKILVMEDGYAAEFDSPKNLLENENSIYYRMAQESGLIN